MGERRNVTVRQSGGPTAAINPSLAGVYKTAKERGFYRVHGVLHGIEGLLEEMYADLSTQIHSGMDIELLKRAPPASLGSCRYKLSDIHENPGFYEKIFGILDKLQIEVFIYVGGDDSMDTVKKLSNYAIVKGHGQKFLEVPKAADNDLTLMDRTLGFGSAAKYIATSTKEVIRDAIGLSFKRKTTTIMGCMGRNAGWLTGSTALARIEDCYGPDLIYLPEIPFGTDKFLRKCEDLIEREPSSVIAVPEGIKVLDGRYVCQLAGGSDYMNAFGHKQLVSTADYLADFLAAELDCKVRPIELSTLQRSASHIAPRVDVNEAFMVGSAAVKATDKGDTGKMVMIDRVPDDPYMSAVGIYNVHKIANNEKVVPRNWVNKDGSYVTQEFVNYVELLIQGDYQSFMANGLPQHPVLKR